MVQAINDGETEILNRILYPERFRVSQLHLTLKPKASAVFADPARFVMATCGRRFGKSYLACAKARLNGPSETTRQRADDCPNPRNGQGDVVAHALRFGADSWVVKTLHSTLEMQLLNGSRIEVKSGDRPDRLRGRSLDMACLDEAAYLSKELWFEVLRPALSDRQGSALFTTTPAGLVQSWYADLWEDQSNGWSKHQYSTIDGGWVSPEEVDQARAMLDPRTFKAEYEAAFMAPTGRCFPDFDERNICSDYDDDGFDALKIGIDFNIATLPAIVCRIVADELWVIDEVTLHNATTEALAKALREKYPSRHLKAFQTQLVAPGRPLQPMPAPLTTHCWNGLESGFTTAERPTPSGTNCRR